MVLFLRNLALLLNLLKTFEDWTAAVDQGCGVDVIYLDYSKAFDIVPHYRLIEKLKGYGISGNLLMWIRSFLLSSRSISEGGPKWNSITVVGDY